MVQHIIKWADDTVTYDAQNTNHNHRPPRRERIERDTVARGPSCRPCSPHNHVHAELDLPSTPHTRPSRHTPPHETAPPPHSQSCWCSTIFGGSFHVGRLGSDDTFDGGSEHAGGPARPAAGDAAG